MSKIKVDEPVKEPTPKTEEQIRAELQAVALIFFILNVKEFDII